MATPRHVWPSDLPAKRVSPSPGLLIAWRRNPDDPRQPWEAWVARVDNWSTGSGLSPQIVQSRVSADQVRLVREAPANARAPLPGA